MSNFLSGAAVMLSMIALLFSGFSVYQVFEMQRTLTAISNSKNPSTATLNQTPPTTVPSAIAVIPSPTAVATPVPTTTLTPSPIPQATAVQTQSLVQPILENQAQMELLSAKRIQDPATGSRNVVTVQMRLRRLADSIQPPTPIVIGQTTARNSVTKETYKPVDPVKRATERVNLSSISKGRPTDAYVWLQVPEGVNTLDIVVPKAGEFKNVPVSN